jgi:hypothetical protein
MKHWKAPKEKRYAKSKMGLPDECYSHAACQLCVGYGLGKQAVAQLTRVTAVWVDGNQLISSPSDHCGKCDACQKGMEPLCEVFLKRFMG